MTLGSCYNPQVCKIWGDGPFPNHQSGTGVLSEARAYFLTANITEVFVLPAENTLIYILLEPFRT